MNDPTVASQRALPRQPFVDLAKGLAAIMIMLHHFSLYGPVAQALKETWPWLSQVLSQYGRYGVQVFLVLGGYLAAQSLMRQRAGPRQAWLTLVLRRWWRLAAPFMAAVCLTLLAHAVTAFALPELLPQEVTGAQLLAHAALLHDVLGMEALTVGAWYVAIDWQLYALLSLLLLAGPASSNAGWRWVPVFVLATLSLGLFNRDAGWDHLGLYFFGSYGLGVACAWMSTHDPGSRVWRVAAGLMLAVTVGALLLDFRERLVCAALTAACLLVLQVRPGTNRGDGGRVMQLMGEWSYALFLVHFAASLLGNAWYLHLGVHVLSGPLVMAALLGMAALSLLMAAGFNRWVEQPLNRLTWPVRVPDQHTVPG
jgi:peptidoglycan/LPS O-acetylase OafA/YrhL